MCACAEIERLDVDAPGYGGRGTRRACPTERLLASGSSSPTGKVALLEHADHGVADEAGGARATRAHASLSRIIRLPVMTVS